MKMNDDECCKSIWNHETRGQRLLLLGALRKQKLRMMDGVGLGGLGGEIGEYPIIIANVNGNIKNNRSSYKNMLSFLASLPHHCSIHDPSPKEAQAHVSHWVLRALNLRMCFIFSKVHRHSFLHVVQWKRVIGIWKPILYWNAIMRGLRWSSIAINKIQSPMDVLRCLLQVYFTALHI